MILTVIRQDNADRYEIHRDVMSGFPDGYKGRILFRVVSNCVLVISPDEPNYSNCLSKRVLSISPESTKFSLEANPTVKRDGRRHGLNQSELLDWFTRKTSLEQSGVEFSSVLTSPPSIVKFNKMSFNRVLFTGIANVVNPEKAAKFIAQGVGSGKGFGFGLVLLENMLC